MGTYKAIFIMVFIYCYLEYIRLYFNNGLLIGIYKTIFHNGIYLLLFGIYKAIFHNGIYLLLFGIYNDYIP